MYKITTVEDQQKFVIPLNRDTEKIFYVEDGNNLRFLIDAKVKTEPRAYIVSKVNRLSPNGLVRITLAQQVFNPHTDYIELDDNGNVVGMWADYYKNQATPTTPSEQELNVYCKITYKGVQNNQFRVNGSARTFVVKFYKGKEEISYQQGSWSFMMGDKQIDKFFLVENQDDNTTKIKYTGPDGYIGCNVQLTYTSVTGISSSIEMTIMGN